MYNTYCSHQLTEHMYYFFSCYLAISIPLFFLFTTNNVLLKKKLLTDILNLNLFLLLLDGKKYIIWRVNLLSQHHVKFILDDYYLVSRRALDALGKLYAPAWSPGSAGSFSW